MSVRVIFGCDSCDAKAEGVLRRRFEGLSGRPWGVGKYITDTPDDVAPEGWVAFDPYTSCCYCPACWASILAPEPVAAGGG
jgi:hypothetical protein